MSPKAKIIVDFENNSNATLQMDAEFGRALNKDVVVFAIPTFHVAGTKRESFRLKVGVRTCLRKALVEAN